LFGEVFGEATGVSVPSDKGGLADWILSSAGDWS
jgi:hypothetical protein